MHYKELMQNVCALTCWNIDWYYEMSTRSQWNIPESPGHNEIYHKHHQDTMKYITKHQVRGCREASPCPEGAASCKATSWAMRPYLDALHGALDASLAVHVTAGAHVRDVAGAVADWAVDAGRCGCCGLRRGIIRVAHEFKSTPQRETIWNACDIYIKSD